MKKLLLTLFLAALSVSAVAQSTNKAELSWVAPTGYSDGTPITGALTYNVYQGPQGTVKTLKVSTGIVGINHLLSSGLLSGSTLCWEVSAVVGTQESAKSNEACKTFPAASLQAPSALSVK